MKKPIFQIRLLLIITLLLAATAVRSQTAPPTPGENTAGTIQTIPCAEVVDPKDRTICELSLMTQKTLGDKRAALDLAQKRLEEIESQKNLTAEQKQLAVELRKVIADLKDQIGFYKDFVELLYKRPPKKCFISIFNC